MTLWHTDGVTTPDDHNTPPTPLPRMTDDEWGEYLDYQESRANAYLCEQGWHETD